MSEKPLYLSLNYDESIEFFDAVLFLKGSVLDKYKKRSLEICNISHELSMLNIEFDEGAIKEFIETDEKFFANFLFSSFYLNDEHKMYLRIRWGFEFNTLVLTQKESEDYCQYISENSTDYNSAGAVVDKKIGAWLKIDKCHKNIKFHPIIYKKYLYTSNKLLVYTLYHNNFTSFDEKTYLKLRWGFL